MWLWSLPTESDVHGAYDDHDDLAIKCDRILPGDKSYQLIKSSDKSSENVLSSANKPSSQKH